MTTLQRQHDGSILVIRENGTRTIVPEDNNNALYKKLISSGAEIISETEGVKNWQVDEERDRRIAQGFNFDGNNFLYDAQRLVQIHTKALASISSGENQEFVFSGVKLDDQEAFAISEFAMEWADIINQKAEALKMMKNIPKDYTEDKWW